MRAQKLRQPAHMREHSTLYIKPNAQHVVAPLSQERPPKSVYICHTCRLGDILHSTVLVHHIKKQNPSLIITWGIGKPYAQVLYKNPEIDHIIEFNSSDPYQLWDMANKYCVDNKFETIIIPQIWPRYHLDYGRSIDNIADFTFKCAGIAVPCPRRPRVIIDQDEITKNKLPHGPTYIALEYNAVSNGNPWPVSYYDELSLLLKNDNIILVAFGGSKDPKIPSALDKRGLSYRDAAATFFSCHGFLGCGSGLGLLWASVIDDKPFIEINLYSRPVANFTGLTTPNKISLGSMGCKYINTHTFGKIGVDELASFVRFILPSLHKIDNII